MPSHDFQQELLKTLADQPLRYFTPNEISLLLRNKHPLAKEPTTVQQHLASLAEDLKVERTPMNHYRHRQQRSLYIAPQIAEILRRSGRSFSLSVNEALGLSVPADSPEPVSPATQSA
jgi:hypothetical protein